MKRVAVIGAGIAGLSAAYRLSRLAAEAGVEIEVVVLEASGRPGGKISTWRGEGFVIEEGPDSFITVKPEALELVGELGLGGRLLATARAEAEVLVYARGRLRAMPPGLLLMAPTLAWPFLKSDIVTWGCKLRMGLDLLIPRRREAGDESMGDFTRRRFGREALETIVAPVMAGIYGGDPDLLSLRSTFPRFIRLERDYGSVLRGVWAAAGRSARPEGTTTFMSLAGGLSELVEALAARLGGRVRLGRRVVAARRQGRLWRLEVHPAQDPGGAPEVLNCDALILTPLAGQAASLVEGFDPALAQALREIPCTSTATVSLAYARPPWDPAGKAFGFVVPRSEGGAVAAATFTHVKFPQRVPAGAALVRCFAGGAGREAALEAGDEDLVRAVRADLDRLAGIRAEPDFVRLRRWPRANPQYTVGHEERVGRIEGRLKAHPGLLAAGASYRGIGIPDCIASGAAAARAAMAFLRGAPC